MARKRCKATGSVSFVRHQDAEKVLGMLNVKGRSELAQVPKSIYRCSHCRRWHVSGYAPDDMKRDPRSVKQANTRRFRNERDPRTTAR